MKRSTYKKFIRRVMPVLLINLAAFSFPVYAESGVGYSVTVEPALNITTSANKVSLDLNPLNHDFDSQDLTVSVSTNNETGGCPADCPAGWRLPTGGTTGEYYTFYNNYYDSLNILLLPVSQGGAAFATAGVFASGAPYEVGNIAQLWTSTKSPSGFYTIQVWLSGNRVLADYDSQMIYARSIRCILK